MSSKRSFQEILEGHRGERHLVVLPDSPAPDAIAAAFAHRLISSAFDIDVSILYSGRLRTRQNVALVKLLGIDFFNAEPGMDLAHFDGAVSLTERKEIAGEVLQAMEKSSLPFVISVCEDNQQELDVIDFRTESRHRAISTLYTTQLQDGPFDMDKARKEHVSTATALLFGILSATDNFVTAAEADFRAASFLSRYRDIELLELIMSQSRSKHTLEMIRRALGNRMTVESYSIAGIGYLRSEDREGISHAADFLLTEDNVHTAIVYGIMMDGETGEYLAGSMRTSKITIYPEEFLQDLFGSMSGHTEAGSPDITGDSFYIPVGFLAGEQSKPYLDLKWLVYDTQLKHKIFERIGVTREVAVQSLEII